MITATNLIVSFKQGTPFTLRMQVLDEQGDAFTDLSERDLTLNMARAAEASTSVLEISGSVIDAAQGYIQFAFWEADTADLPSVAYDVEVFVDNWPVLDGRIGLTKKNPEVGG